MQIKYNIFLLYIFRYLRLMELKKFLEENEMISPAALARAMWPDKPSAKSRLTNKLNENKAGTGVQRITEKDMESAKKALGELADNIRKFTSQ